MRIVQLSTMMSYYGGEVHLASLAGGLQAMGHDVVCVVRPGSELADALPGLGVEVRSLPLVDWYDPPSVTRLGYLVRHLRCEILHTHLPRDYFLASVATLGTTVVNVGTRHQLRPLSHALLKRPFLQRFSGFIAVSDAVRQGLLQADAVPEERITVIPHGLDNREISPSVQAATGRLRLQVGALGSDQLIGCVARLCPTKGIDTLIDAFASLKNCWPRLKLCLVGDETPGSGYREKLQGRINLLGLKDRVFLTGYLEDAGRLSGAFDIQVVPSAAEPFGLVTLEAMNAGVPVVVTDSGGSPEIVRDGVDGFLFGPGDAAALARKLESLLESPGLRVEMGRRGRQRIKSTFSRQDMLTRTEAVYLQALKGKSEPAGGQKSA